MYISFNAKIFKLYSNGYSRSLSTADFCTLNRTNTATVNELGTNDIIQNAYYRDFHAVLIDTKV